MSIDDWIGSGIPDEVMEAAAVWVARLDDEDTSLQTRQDFFSWLDNNPMHRWAYEEISESWARMSTLQKPSELAGDNVVPFSGGYLEQASRTEAISKPICWWHAAGVAALLLLGVFVGHDHKQEESTFLSASNFESHSFQQYSD
ncbi:MAG: DUF4880 domain-containing protein [Pseudomonadales bacterium]